MENKEFNEYIKTGFEYQGMMNSLGTTIDFMLDSILKKLDVKSPDMLGKKIKQFEKSKDRYTGDFDNLVKKLVEFNKIWIITKHGMLVGGLKDLTFHKDGQFHTFDQSKQAEISREFTEIMKDLTKIHNAI